MSTPSDRLASHPADDAGEITKSDVLDLTNYTRGLYIGTAGSVKVEMVAGGIVTFVALAVGVVHPLRVKRVYSTGTTADNIVGVW